MNSVEKVNKVVEEYIKWVFSLEEIKYKDFTTDDDMDDYLMEEFRFSAVNNFIEGYDIIGFYEYELDGSLANLFDCHTCCKLIGLIQTYHKNYGDASLMDCLEITPENILRNYAYIYLYDMSVEDLKKLLDWK